MENNRTIWRAKAPTRIIDLLRNYKNGTVSMKNSRGIYLSFGGEMILLCDSKWGTVPCGISIENYDDFLQSHHICENMPVGFSDNAILLPSGAVSLDIAGVAPDNSIITPSKKDFTEALLVLKASAKPTGLAGLGEVIFGNKAVCANVWCEKALPKLKLLIAALNLNDETGVSEAADSLLGLGTGLTPSGDDVLAGIYYGLSHSVLSHYKSVTALRRVIANADKKTTPVSVALLNAISNNSPFDLLGGTWRDINCSKELVKAGNHSGTEMLLGLLCAMAIIIAKAQNKNEVEFSV